MVGVDGIEPTQQKQRIYSPSRLSNSGVLPNIVKNNLFILESQTYEYKRFTLIYVDIIEPIARVLLRS